MATKKIDQNDVFSVCNDLSAAGEEPSTLKVHKLLQAGSFSTIQKHIAAWRETEEAQATSQPAPADAVPEEFLAEADIFVKKLFQAAKKQHAVALEKIQNDFNAEIEKAKKSEKEAINYADELNSKNEQLNEQLQNANTKIESLEASNKQQIETITAANTKALEMLENANNETVKALQSNIDVLKSELESFKQKHRK